MKPVIFFTAKELDTFIAGIVNARFNAFLAKFCAAQRIDFGSSMDAARNIMRDAEIPQPGDELLAGAEHIDMSSFYENDE